MAWIAEEIAPEHLGKTMGLYIAGTAFGGMMGRVGMGILVEYFSWRTALGLLGAICFICSIAFLKLLPASRNFVQKKGLNLGFHIQMWRAHLSNTKLLRLFAIGFLLTSVFVTLFNYATFRLSGAPYSLSQTQISLIFLSYSFGMVSSSLAGSLADRFGKKTMMMSGFALMILGSLMTLLSSLFGIIIGIAFITTGFFITHSLTSSSVGAESKQAKAHASSLYLLFYYMGSSIVGSAGGWFWLHGGWSAIVGLTVFLSLIGIFLAVYTSHAKAH
ncbi:MFS transporter family protein [Acinetobacter baumannii 6013113]|nr:MFS transporter family protein [Acinetobacter baumannii 6013113]